MNAKKIWSLLIATIIFTGFNNAQAEDFKVKVQASMKTLIERLNTFGAPKLEGTGTISGKPVPVIFFGTKKINEKYDVVDEVKKIHGGTATVFVKVGDEYIRVSTNVMKDAESRAIGTPLARNPAYAAIIKGESFFGQVEILGKPYETGYAPIKNASGEIIGIYYVGFLLK